VKVGKRGEQAGQEWGIDVVFRGANVLTLDDKGRMAMPAKYREQLTASCDGRLIITVGRDRCLLLYPLPVWEEIEAQLNQLPGLDPNVRLLQRNLIGRSEDLELDAQGRVRLPPQLREFAQLEKRIALVGVTKKFELWNEETLAEQHKAWAKVTDSQELNAALASLPL